MLLASLRTRLSESVRHAAAFLKMGRTTSSVQLQIAQLFGALNVAERLLTTEECVLGPRDAIEQKNPRRQPRETKKFQHNYDN